ncbi:hypothetical protein [Paeniglutamicibacter kerguelensis]|uniref:META domain-containing protein n=1 Tax=Paeniglutamicibacter kerguelensis TaxID=254788 RepID=A0ABS4XD87_9MICC|nr:hypothetical protein [Paeniglutamicibacter kerguelensis]MBP2386437.1 hypothetical protein [Paeniglutamicibacter kerguelensis]
MQVATLGMVLTFGAILAGCAQPGSQAGPDAGNAVSTDPGSNPSLVPPPAAKTVPLAVDSLVHDGKRLDNGEWKTVLLPEPLEGGTISVPGVCNGPSFTIESAKDGSWKTAKNATEDASGCSDAGHELKAAVVGALAGKITVTHDGGKTILTHGGYALTLSGP